MWKSSNWRASQSRAVLGYSEGFIQSPCSRQRMRILVSARLHATAAPEAPAPMIRTSTGVVIVENPARDASQAVEGLLARLSTAASALRGYLSDGKRGAHRASNFC